MTKLCSYYPLIVESARYADDYSWVEVAINPRARFHDGSPITARDVEFTFQKFMTEGVPYLVWSTKVPLSKPLHR